MAIFSKDSDLNFVTQSAWSWPGGGNELHMQALNFNQSMYISASLALAVVKHKTKKDICLH